MDRYTSHRKNNTIFSCHKSDVSDKNAANVCLIISPNTNAFTGFTKNKPILLMFYVMLNSL